MIIQIRDRKQIAILLLVLIAVVLMPGCSSFKIEYPEDKIAAIKVPANVFVVWHDTPENVPMHNGGHVDGITIKSPRADFYVAHVIRGNACIFEHEIKHASGDMTHDGWSKRLLECKA